MDESQGSSPLQGHDSWLMCEVALSMMRLGNANIIEVSSSRQYDKWHRIVVLSREYKNITIKYGLFLFHKNNIGVENKDLKMYV